MRRHVMLSVSAATLMVSGIACAAAPAGPGDFHVGEPIQLSVGGNAAIAGTPIRMRVIGVNDYRCPSDAYCFWEGDAAVALTVTGAGEQPIDSLFLYRSPHEVVYGGQSWPSFNRSYRIELLDVLPHRTLGNDGVPREAVLVVRASP